jgi:hypothetical protein
MKKYLLSLLALSAVLLGATPASAEPISSAIGLTALIGSVFGIGTAAGGVAAAVGGFIVSAVAGIAVSTGLSLLARSMQPKPKAGDTLTGVETSIQIGGDTNRQIPMGTCGVRGQLIYHNTMGGLNEFHQRVYVLADWTCDSLLSVIIDGKKHSLTVTSSDSEKINYSIPDYPGVVTLCFYRGNQTAADTALVTLANPAGRWDTNSVAKGMCYVIVYFTYSQGAPLFENGIPEMMFELKGALLYDWRKDTTNGGSGAHRWDTPSTWEWSDNPVVMAYNYQRGFYLNGEKIIGMGMPDTDIILSTYTAAANICDENVTLDAGGTEKRYRCAMIVTADENVSHGSVLDQVQVSFAGYFIDYQGFYYCQAGAALAVSDTITDDDLVIGEPVQVARKRSRNDLFNRVHGQYLDTSQVYGPQSYGSQVDAGATTNDGEELGKPLDLLNVPSRTQAERIAKIKLRECRLQTRAAITLGFNHVAKEVGDWITWNSAKWGNRTYRIVNRVITTQRRVGLELEEIVSTAYSWNAADEAVAPVGGITITAGTRISTVAGFSVQALALTNSDGSTIPGLKFTWTPIDDPTVTQVVIEYRPVSSPNDVTTTGAGPSLGKHTVSSNVRGGVNYEARATINTDPARITTWTSWFAVLTDEMALFADITLDSWFALIDEEEAAGPLGLPVLLNSGITSSLIKSPDGPIITRVVADWPDVTDAYSYEVEYQEGSGNFISYPSPVSRYEWTGRSVPGTLIHIRVRGVTQLGTVGPWSVIDATHGTHTVALNTTPPAAITGLSGTAAFQSLFLYWQNPADSDYSHAEFVTAPINDRTAMNYGPIIIKGSPGTFSTYTVTGITPGTTRYIWVRPFNTSGTPGPWTPVSSTGGFPLTAQSINVSADIAAGAIDQTRFANSLRIPDVVASLPATGNWVDRVVIRTSDSLAYKWNGSGWVRAYGQDFLGVDSIQAATVTAGAIGVNQLAAKAVTTSKLAVGSKNVAFNADITQGPSGLNGFQFFNSITHSGLNSVTGQWSPAGTRSVYVRNSGAPVGGEMTITNRPMNPDGSLGFYPVLPASGPTPAKYYQASVSLSMHRCSGQLFIIWVDAAGEYLASTGGSIVPSNGADGGNVIGFPRSTIIAQPPAGATQCYLYCQAHTLTGLTDVYMFASCWMFAGASPDQTEVDPYVDPGITIIDGGNIKTQSIVTAHMVANTIHGDVITSGTLQANRLLAGSIMTAGVIVNGQSLDDTTARAFDPAFRINSYTTQINPGSVLISGATSLNDWRDVTEIRGGAIKSYSVTTEKLVITTDAQNLLFNSDLQMGTAGYYKVVDTTSLPNSMGVSGNGVAGSYSIYHEFYPNIPAFGTQIDIANRGLNPSSTGPSYYPVGVGIWYEASVYLNCLRCSANVIIVWLNGLFEYIGESHGNVIPTHSAYGAGATGLALSRSRVVAQAPAGAVYAYLITRQTNSGVGSWPSDPTYCFASAWLFKQTPDSTYVTPYAPRSSTVIHGGQITTGSLHANRIQANTIDANQIRTDVAVITTAAQITKLIAGTAHIVNLSVDTLQVANNAITNQSATSGTVGAGSSLALVFTVRSGATLLISVGAHNHLEQVSSAGSISEVVRTYNITIDGVGTLFQVYGFNQLSQVTSGPTYLSRCAMVSSSRVVSGIGAGTWAFRINNPSNNNADLWIAIVEILK